MSTPRPDRSFRLPWRRQPADLPDFAAPPGRFGDAFRSLKHRNYRLFYFGQGISLSGTWMQTIAQAWLIIELTDSKAALGLVTLLQFLPITLFTLIGGVVADRVPKRNFILFTQFVAMGQAIILTVLVWSGEVHVWHVYVLAFVLGLSTAFEQPTRQAFVIEMVGREDLLNAVAMNSGLFNGARLVGPAIGGAIIAIAGVKTAFLINAISFVPVIAALLMMDLTRLYSTDKSGGVALNGLAELKEGLTYALRTPAAFVVLLVVGIVGTFGYNFTVMLPLIAKYVLHEGSTVLGFLTAAVGCGALMAALLLATRRRASHFTLFLGASAFAVLLVGVALSQWLYVTLPLLLLVGFASTSFAATANTSLQLSTPDRLRGRVMSVFFLLLAGSTPIGAWLTGFLSEQIGVPTTIGIFGVLCGVGVAIGLLYYASHREEISRPDPGLTLEEAAT